MKKLLFVLLIALLAVGCGGTAAPSGTHAESDSDQDFASVRGDQYLPIDFGVYHISGEILPQEVPFENATMIEGVTVPGVLTRPYRSLTDKSLVRLAVTDVEYIPSDVDVNLVEEVDEMLPVESIVDQVIVVKVTDLKILASQIGDKVELACRVQVESVAAIAENEPRRDILNTLELDYCRYYTPVVSNVQGK